jgi:hypothetical protein
MDIDFLDPIDPGVQLSVPPSILGAFTTRIITILSRRGPPSTDTSLSASMALTTVYALFPPTQLVPRLIYIPVSGFEGRVILTSTAGASRLSNLLLAV